MDPASDSLGPLSSGTITSGSALTASQANENVAVVDSSYAKSENLKTGSKITVAGKSFTVVGIVQAAQGVTDADVYIPLARAQALANMAGEVNTIYVSAASATDISAVSSEIAKALPTATVTTSSDLASEVTGSLSSASTLANNLGKWLAVAVLAAAFGLASILTMSAVSRRVREFGTLKAIGWNRRTDHPPDHGRIAGHRRDRRPCRCGRRLRRGGHRAGGGTTADRHGSAGAGASRGRWRRRGGGGLARGASAAAHTVSVHLTAPVTLARAWASPWLLAIVGGLMAGTFGGWPGRPPPPGGRALPPRIARPGGTTESQERTFDVQAHRRHQGLPERPRTVQALQGVDLVIEDGEWLAIQGPTGHGKSTLLQILGGLDRPTKGVVELAGRNLARLGEGPAHQGPCRRRSGSSSRPST